MMIDGLDRKPNQPVSGALRGARAGGGRRRPEITLARGARRKVG
jgi:hypothetical protein